MARALDATGRNGLPASWAITDGPTDAAGAVKITAELLAIGKRFFTLLREGSSATELGKYLYDADGFPR